jgi:predicted TIM-barrel fold metal-dependent hydrolase
MMQREATVDEITKHDPDAGLEPALAAPPNACDSHFHVFGIPEKYAYGTDIRYKPPYEPIERYLKLARRLGLVRYVFVQPSAYGFDNSCMLDAMRELDPAIRRGIVDLDETTTGDRELDDWDAIGVRGIRVNISPIRKPEAGLAASMRPRIARLAKICVELGWHLDFLTPGWLVSELMPTLRELPVEFSVAHMGLFPAKDGPKQSGFQEFLDMVGDGSARCWVKLTGIYRFSAAPDFADVKPIAQALMERAPEQLIWGSDFPHLSFHDRVGTIQLYNLLGEWVPDPKLRKRILADNPARLFGFG